jgi:hypothetical protein
MSYDENYWTQQAEKWRVQNAADDAAAAVERQRLADLDCRQKDAAAQDLAAALKGQETFCRPLGEMADRGWASAFVVPPPAPPEQHHPATFASQYTPATSAGDDVDWSVTALVRRAGRAVLRWLALLIMLPFAIGGVCCVGAGIRLIVGVHAHSPPPPGLFLVSGAIFLLIASWFGKVARRLK